VTPQVYVDKGIAEFEAKKEAAEAAEAAAAAAAAAEAAKECEEVALRCALQRVAVPHRPMADDDGASVHRVPPGSRLPTCLACAADVPPLEDMSEQLAATRQVTPRMPPSVSANTLHCAPAARLQARHGSESFATTSAFGAFDEALRTADRGCPTEVSAHSRALGSNPAKYEISHNSVRQVKADERRMSSILRNGQTFHGISVDGRGVLKLDKYGWTYAGQCKDGYACGLGVLMHSDGTKNYAEHGPDGQYDGRHLWRFADGDTYYRLYERGKEKDFAIVFADGYCKYNFRLCAPDDPRLLALIAQVAPVQVRLAAPAPTRYRRPLVPKQSYDESAGSVCPPQALATAVATEVHPPRRTPSLVAVRHNPRPAALQSTTTQ
jgi:hypothetical protein